MKVCVFARCDLLSTASGVYDGTVLLEGSWPPGLAARAGRSLPIMDSLLAATALHHGLRLVTRNTRDFQFPGLDVVNPWEL